MGHEESKGTNSTTVDVFIRVYGYRGEKRHHNHDAKMLLRGVDSVNVDEIVESFGRIGNFDWVTVEYFGDYPDDYEGDIHPGHFAVAYRDTGFTIEVRNVNGTGTYKYARTI